MRKTKTEKTCRSVHDEPTERSTRDNTAIERFIRVSIDSVPAVCLLDKTKRHSSEIDAVRRTRDRTKKRGHLAHMEVINSIATYVPAGAVGRAGGRRVRACVDPRALLEEEFKDASCCYYGHENITDRK